MNHKWIFKRRTLRRCLICSSTIPYPYIPYLPFFVFPGVKKSKKKKGLKRPLVNVTAELLLIKLWSLGLDPRREKMRS